MALLKFLKGNYSSLNTAAIAEGQVLICGDTGEMFVDVAADKRVKIGDFTIVANTAALDALDATTIPTTRLYYVEEGNILARFNGTKWSQINKQLTADQIKTMISLADYETKADAADKLTEAKGYTDSEVAKVQGAVEGLEDLVGTLPEGDAKTIVDYVNAKTTGIATDTALANLQKDLDTAEEKIADLEKANAEGGAVHTAISEVQRAAADAAAAAGVADEKAAAAQKDVDDLETIVSEYKIANDKAVKDAADAAAAAQSDVDNLESKIGVESIPEGITAVKMIQDAQQAARDAMGEAALKVASVTAADNSITVGGTETEPTIAAKVSADADNVLKLVEDGLKVVIPAAAEYAIVKAEDSGDYAAVYNLTKDGEIVGASINIPKDLVVKSGSVVDGEIVLVLNDASNTEIRIPAESLIEYVTSGSNAGDMVVVNVSDDHKVTATITDGTINLAKLDVDVQTAIGKAHSHENADVLNGITAANVSAWDQAERNAIGVATELDDAMNARVEKLEAIDHEHANLELLETYTQTEANLADAVAKKHEHTNADVLDGITAEKVTAWDSAKSDAIAYADGLNTDMNTRVETLEAIDHEHTNKVELDLIVSGDKAKWDIAAEKAHEHANAVELDKIVEGDKAKWDAAEQNAKNYTDEALTWGSF